LELTRRGILKPIGRKFSDDEGGKDSISLMEDNALFWINKF
jgi:hypothetical protein